MEAHSFFIFCPLLAVQIRALELFFAFFASQFTVAAISHSEKISGLHLSRFQWDN